MRAPIASAPERRGMRRSTACKRQKGPKITLSGQADDAVAAGARPACRNAHPEVEVETMDRGSVIAAGANTIVGMATTEDRDSLDATQAWREELYDRTPERQGELF